MTGGTLVSFNLKNDMRLVVYFDGVDIEDIEEDQLVKEAIKRTESNGINIDLFELDYYYDIEPY